MPLSFVAQTKNCTTVLSPFFLTVTKALRRIPWVSSWFKTRTARRDKTLFLISRNFPVALSSRSYLFFTNLLSSRPVVRGALRPHPGKKDNQFEFGQTSIPAFHKY